MRKDLQIHLFQPIKKLVFYGNYFVDYFGDGKLCPTVLDKRRPKLLPLPSLS